LFIFQFSSFNNPQKLMNLLFCMFIFYFFGEIFLQFVRTNTYVLNKLSATAFGYAHVHQ